MFKLSSRLLQKKALLENIRFCAVCFFLLFLIYTLGKELVCMSPSVEKLLARDSSPVEVMVTMYGSHDAELHAFKGKEEFSWFELDKGHVEISKFTFFRCDDGKQITTELPLSEYKDSNGNQLNGIVNITVLTDVLENKPPVIRIDPVGSCNEHPEGGVFIGHVTVRYLGLKGENFYREDTFKLHPHFFR